MQFQNPNAADDSANLPKLFRCTHCGEETTKGSKYCKFCTKANERREIDEENEAILGHPIARNANGIMV